MSGVGGAVVGRKMGRIFQDRGLHVARMGRAMVVEGRWRGVGVLGGERATGEGRRGKGVGGSL